MNAPDNLKYTKDHEWVKVTGNIATIGITDFAQTQLGDIVFVELPDEGEELAKDESFGTVESVKSASDCMLPVSGRITEVNDILKDAPEIVNEDCYGEGWMVKVELMDKVELEDLMSAEEYQQFMKEEGQS